MYIVYFRLNVSLITSGLIQNLYRNPRLSPACLSALILSLRGYFLNSGNYKVPGSAVFSFLLRVHSLTSIYTSQHSSLERRQNMILP